MNSNIAQSFETFCSNYKVLSYKKGDMILRGDDEPTGVYMLKDGVVKMSYFDEEGEELIVNIFKPGTFFPMCWAIGDQKNSYYYQAITSSKLVRASKEDFLDFIRKDVDVLYDLTKRILVGLDGLLFNVRYLIGNNSVSKVAVILFSLAKRFGVKNGNMIEITINLTHQDISHFAGLTRETTTLAIKKLVDDGIITQKQRKINIKDLESLEKYF